MRLTWRKVAAWAWRAVKAAVVTVAIVGLLWLVVLVIGTARGVCAAIAKG